MEQTVCLVTGATSGLGKATALALARQGATVVLGCRDSTSGEAARSEIRAASHDDTVHVLPIDLASQQSVRAAAEDIRRRFGRLDVLVNNAAVMHRTRVVTLDGLEAMFATNHLGPFLLTTLLLATLQASAPARILTITAPSTDELDFTDLQGERKFSALHAFGASKTCNLLFTYELAQRLAGSGVTANAVHPGLVRSNLLRRQPLPMRALAWLISSSPPKAAEGVVYCATSPEVAGVSGAFFKGRHQIESSAYSRREDVQLQLWEVSEALISTTQP